MPKLAVGLSVRRSVTAFLMLSQCAPIEWEPSMAIMILTPAGVMSVGSSPQSARIVCVGGGSVIVGVRILGSSGGFPQNGLSAAHTGASASTGASAAVPAAAAEARDAGCCEARLAEHAAANTKSAVTQTGRRDNCENRTNID